MQAGLLNKGIDRGAGRPSKDRATVERGERSQVTIMQRVLSFAHVFWCPLVVNQSSFEGCASLRTCLIPGC